LIVSRFAREHLKIEGVLSNIELLVELIFLDQALVEFSPPQA